MNKHRYKCLFPIIAAILFVTMTSLGIVTHHRGTATDAAVEQGRDMWLQYGFAKSAITIFQLHWRAYMHEVKHNNPNPELFPQKQPNPDQHSRVRELEEKCRSTGLIFREDIQLLLKPAYCSSGPVCQSAVHRLEIAIEAYEVEKIRVPDSFKPYGPECLLSQGDLHILDQIDGVKWMIPVDIPLTGVLILGPQKGGKSRFIIHLCQEILRVNPGITLTIIDPKDGFRDYTPALAARRIDLADVALDLKQPCNIDRQTFVLEFMPPLADTAGLIYGVEPLNEAALIALAQRDEYVAATGNETELCLKDIYVALSLVREASSGRRMGYREAAQTALHRIIGDGKLFACRRGISMEELCTRNTILDARSITDDMTCRTLALYFLYWNFQESRHKPETNKLKHLIIIDDASRYIGTPGDQFGAISRTSPVGHILAQLRSTGTGLVAATQLPAFIDPSVLALSRTMLVVGGISGAQHLKVITDFMSLDKEQISDVIALSTREAVGFSPGTEFKGIVHGWVPYVETTPVKNINEIASADLEIQPWHHLLEIPAQTTTYSEKSGETKATEKEKEPILKPASSNSLFTNHQTHRLIFDSVCYPFHSATARIKRLKLSGRDFENAKIEACEKGYLVASKAGSTLYLIPTQQAFDMFEMECPFKRTTSLEHAFYVGLGKFLLENDVRIKSVKAEVPIGNTGSAADIVTFANNGQMEVWEVCLGTNYILANITKYKNTAFSKITLLSKDWELSQAIQKLIKFSGLETELLEKVEYTHFSKLLGLQRKLSRY
jgi:hypothetical protein